MKNIRLRKADIPIPDATDAESLYPSSVTQEWILARPPASVSVSEKLNYSGHKYKCDNIIVEKMPQFTKATISVHHLTMLSFAN